jgi:signal transduction histidine kinase
MAELARLLDAVHMAAEKLASTADTKVVLREVLSICVEATGAAGGSIYIHDPATKTLRFLHVLPDEVERKLERLDLPDDYGVAGDVFQSGKTQVNTYGTEGDPHRKAIVRRTGLTVRNMITIPLQITGLKPIGIVQLVNKRLGTFDETDEAVLDTISDVATLAIMNSRMLDRSTKVAALEGMGRAAHDLANKAGVLVTFLPDFERNLNGLRAALATGEQNNEAKFYMEMLQGTYEDVFAPYSQRVYRYAKLVNDLAAGKELVPQRKFWNFAAVVREAAQYMESSARRSHVKLIYDLQLDAPEFAFDDLYVIRIVENLVGNAIKAVNETIPDSWLAENGGDVDATYGSVRIQYRLAGENHILVVSDDGPGMSPGTIRQILGGSAKSNWEQSTGSGLGTKVITELAMAHGAKLSIRSKLGEGSVFEVDFGTGEVPATMKSETLARSRQ